MVAFTVVNVTLAYGLAYATIPDRGVQIHECFKTGDAEKLGGGALSVIDPDGGGTCNQNQTAISFTDQELVTGDSWAPGSPFLGPGSGDPIGRVIEVTTTRPTSLLIIGGFRANVECATGARCFRSAQVFIDDEGVWELGSSVGGHQPGETRFEDFTVFSVEDVGAGTHTIQWREQNSDFIEGEPRCPPNSPSSSSVADLEGTSTMVTKTGAEFAEQVVPQTMPWTRRATRAAPAERRTSHARHNQIE